jgi:hypothetical protein
MGYSTFEVTPVVRWKPCKSRKLLINAVGALSEITQSVLHTKGVLCCETNTTFHQLRSDALIGKQLREGVREPKLLETLEPEGRHRST